MACFSQWYCSSWVSPSLSVSLTTLSTQQTCNIESQCHCDPCVCELTSQSPNLYRAAKQASVSLRSLEGRCTDAYCTISALNTLMIYVSQQFALYTLSLSSLTLSFQGSSSYLPAHAVTASGSPETITNQ